MRTTRRQKRLSQERLGRLLGMSRATISGIETGRIQEIGLRKVMALLASLGLELMIVAKQRYPTLQELRRENHEEKRR